MNIITYLGKILYGLPTYDSSELIAAKNYHPSMNYNDSDFSYDLYRKDMDSFMFGAISPINNKNDLLNSKELEARANKIYKLCD